VSIQTTCTTVVVLSTDVIRYEKRKRSISPLVENLSFCGIFVIISLLLFPRESALEVEVTFYAMEITSCSLIPLTVSLLSCHHINAKATGVSGVSNSHFLDILIVIFLSSGSLHGYLPICSLQASIAELTLRGSC